MGKFIKTLKYKFIPTKTRVSPEYFARIRPYEIRELKLGIRLNSSVKRKKVYFNSWQNFSCTKIAERTVLTDGKLLMI